mmetsp:Transcript_20226/g.49612  ORF Transcript_20226/g.49612 Transcript_20226/m.49612 type:complete len:112 (-) Transcript_20226:111-446(-)
MGKAKHMEAMKDIIPNLVKAALVFPMVVCEVMEDGKANTVVSGGDETEEEKRALSTTPVLVTSSVNLVGFGAWLLDNCTGLESGCGPCVNASMVATHQTQTTSALISNFIL